MMKTILDKIKRIWKNKVAKTVIKLAFTLILLTVFFFQISSKNIKIDFSDFSLGYYLLAYTVATIGVFICARRWQLMLASQNIAVNFFVLLKLYYIGLFFNNFFLGTLGGDSIKAYNLNKLVSSASKSVSSVLIDRILGVIALIHVCFFALISSIFLGINSRIPEFNLILSINIIIIVMFYLIFSTLIILYKKDLLKKLGNWISQKIKHKNKINEIFDELISYKSNLFRVFAWAVVFQLTTVISGYLLNLVVNLDIEIHLFFIVIPVISFIMMLPITIQGIGLREVLFLTIFAQYGATQSGIVSYIIFTYIALILSSLVGVILWVINEFGNKKVENESSLS